MNHSQGNDLSEARWYYMDCRGQRQGPFADADVCAAYQRGDVLRTGLVWREGMPQWLPLAQLENELGLGESDHVAAPPPLPEAAPDTAPPARTRSVDRNDVVYAGFIRRWAALFLDQMILLFSLVIVIVLLAILFGLSSSRGHNAAEALATGLCYLLWLIAAPLYYAGQESSVHQATLGKRALGIKVTDDNGQRLSFSHALGRWFAAALSHMTMDVGFLMAAFTERKQALHDMITSTLVVDRWAWTEFPERQQRSPSGCLIAFLVVMIGFVPVVAILAAIAIPAYQDYVIRAQVSEGVALGDGVKTAMADYYQNHGRFPASNDQAGLASASSIRGHYVSSVDVGTPAGVITVTYSHTPPNKANSMLEGKTLQFEASPQQGGIEWHCKSPDLKKRWCSSRCECSG